MSYALDMARIDVVAQSRYDRWLARNQSPLHADPTAQACLTAKLSRVFFTGEYTSEKSSNIVAATYAAKLAVAISHWGMSFDDVVDVADFGVAQLVSQVSPDLRAPSGPRHLDLKTRLYQAQPVAQLIQLAVITCVASRLVATCDEATFLEHGAALREWAENSLDILHALTKIAGKKDITPFIEQAKSLIKRVLGEVDAARKARKLARKLAKLQVEAEEA
jgi:hypothetical protein